MTKLAIALVAVFAAVGCSLDSDDADDKQTPPAEQQSDQAQQTHEQAPPPPAAVVDTGAKPLLKTRH